MPVLNSFGVVRVSLRKPFSSIWIAQLPCLQCPPGCIIDEVLQGPCRVHDERMGMALRCVCQGHTSSSRLSTGSMLLVVEGFSSPRVARASSETQCRNGLPMAGSKLTDTPYMSIRCTDAYSLKKMCCNTKMTAQTIRCTIQYLLHIESKQDGVVHLLMSGGGEQRAPQGFCAAAAHGPQMQLLQSIALKHE